MSPFIEKLMCCCLFKYFWLRHHRWNNNLYKKDLILLTTYRIKKSKTITKHLFYLFASNTFLLFILTGCFMKWYRGLICRKSNILKSDNICDPVMLTMIAKYISFFFERSGISWVTYSAVQHKSWSTQIQKAVFVCCFLSQDY